MTRKISMVGDVYGCLTVIKEHSSNSKKVKWLCRCSCGNETIVERGNLRNGTTQSCGCLRRRNLLNWIAEKGRKSLFEIGEIGHYNYYRRSAKVRKIEFRISKEQFVKIVSMSCSYCGSLPKENLRHYQGEDKRSCIPGQSPIYKANGIDRVDSSKGYVEGNCVASCGTCNTMKMSMSVQEFKDHIERTYNHSGAFSFSLVNMCTDRASVLEFISKAA